MLDRLSQVMAQVRGLPILLGVGLALINFVLQFINVPVIETIADTDLFLHLGVVVGFMGVLFADALGAW